MTSLMETTSNRRLQRTHPRLCLRGAHGFVDHRVRQRPCSSFGVPLKRGVRRRPWTVLLLASYVAICVPNLACRKEPVRAVITPVPTPSALPPVWQTPARMVATAEAKGSGPHSPPGGVYRVGGQVSPPELISRPDGPLLPKDFGKHRFEGALFIIEAVIDEQGNVRDVTITRAPKITPPWPELEPLMRASLSKWRYRPATLAGKPVAVYLTVTVSINFM
jgi:hypothetical protein